MTTPQELRALATAATKLPWVAQSRDDGQNEPWYIDTHAYEEGPEPVFHPDSYPLGAADAAYIVAAANAVPDLLDRIGALEGALNETLAALTDVFPLIPAADDWRGSVEDTLMAARAALEGSNR